MKFDIFFSICQTEVDGWTPSETQMLTNFFDQVELADELGFTTAWLAEVHLSCETQKLNPKPVIPEFKGEIGLNTDVLQMAHKIFARTKNINIGSAIRNILCNGGPIAHAEAVRGFLTLHGLDPDEKRILELGFASGRFEFSNRPYGIYPRNSLEEAAWPVLKGQIFKQATEIFLRLLQGETLSSKDVIQTCLKRSQFRSDEDWKKVLTAAEQTQVDAEIMIPPRWSFEALTIVPKETSLQNLKLTIGSHDPDIQNFANTFYPCGVFNLSITPSHEIEETHQRMQQNFHKDGGAWSRERMPRTVLVFINNDENISDSERNQRAHKVARQAISTYWKALAGTIDPSKIEKAVDNALVGCPSAVIEQMQSRFTPDDRLMLWFDFHNHNNEDIKNSMRVFMEQVAPYV